MREARYRLFLMFATVFTGSAVTWIVLGELWIAVWVFIAAALAWYTTVREYRRYRRFDWRD